MKKITIGIALVLTLVMATSAVWAWDFSDHVKMAPNGKGDALIFPFYVALPGGWETKVSVINTATDRSIVAKVIVRSAYYSTELLDFLIYLTPTDVWTGTIRVNSSNQVEFTSTDDSVFAAANTWATAANPFKVTIQNPPCVGPDTTSIGYIEVIEAAHSTANGVGLNAVSGGSNVSLNTPPVSKWALFNAYGGASLTGLNMVTDGINVMSGYMEFRNIASGHNTAVQATTLRDYDGTLQGGTPLTVSQYTALGEANAWNSLGEIEATLSKNQLAMPYSNGAAGNSISAHIFTFPTKLTTLNGTATQCTAGITTPSPFFNTNTSAASGWCIPYLSTDYDLTEQSRVTNVIISPAPRAASMCQEVNILTPSGAYPEGWTRYFFGASAAGTYTTNFNIQKLSAAPIEGAYDGAPVIGTVVNIVGAATVGSATDGFWSVPASYTDGYVRATTVPVVDYYYYQYQDETNRGIGYDADLAGSAPNPALIFPDSSRPERYTLGGPVLPADLMKPTQPAVADVPY